MQVIWIEPADILVEINTFSKIFSPMFCNCYTRVVLEHSTSNSRSSSISSYDNIKGLVVILGSYGDLIQVDVLDFSPEVNLDIWGKFYLSFMQRSHQFRSRGAVALPLFFSEDFTSRLHNSFEEVTMFLENLMGS